MAVINARRDERQWQLDLCMPAAATYPEEEEGMLGLCAPKSGGGFQTQVAAKIGVMMKKE
jgi:hypothetical protein